MIGVRLIKGRLSFAMERSPIKDLEIKFLLKEALTDKINDCEVYMKALMQVIIMKVTMFSKRQILNRRIKYFLKIEKLKSCLNDKRNAILKVFLYIIL